MMRALLWVFAAFCLAFSVYRFVVGDLPDGLTGALTAASIGFSAESMHLSRMVEDGRR